MIKNNFTINEIKKAGKNLIKNDKVEESLEILSFWRTCHVSSLEKAYDILKVYAPKVDKKALLAKRLKRTPSIITKLKRFNSNGMQLTTMQDIGGCRVIVSSIKKVNKLAKLLVKDRYFELRNDYILKPKDDGYRSVHLIGKFENEYGNERNIELQIRTTTQHSWATAIEIVDLFTNQSIKTNSGDVQWTIFFKYVSNLFVLLEENPYLTSSKLENTFRKMLDDAKLKENQHFEESFYRVHSLSKKLSILKKFGAFTESLKITSEHIEKHQEKIPQNSYVLISIDEIDGNTFGISLQIYDKGDFNKATEQYLEYEKSSVTKAKFLTVLVATTALGGVKEAYPNYFADSTKFINLLQISNKVYETINPTIFQIGHRIKYGLMPKK